MCMLKRPTCAGKHHQCDPHIAWSGVPWQQLSRPWQNWQGKFKRQGSSSKFWKFVEQRELLMFSDFLQNHAPLQRIFVDGAIPQVLLWYLMSHPCSTGWMAEVQLRCYDSRLKFQCPQVFNRSCFPCSSSIKIKWDPDQWVRVCLNLYGQQWYLGVIQNSHSFEVSGYLGLL